MFIIGGIGCVLCDVIFEVIVCVFVCEILGILEVICVVISIVESRAAFFRVVVGVVVVGVFVVNFLGVLYVVK